MRLAVPIAAHIGRTVVAGGDTHRDAHRRGCLQRLIQSVEKLRGQLAVGILRTAPADRYHGRLAHAVVHRGLDGIDEPAAGIGREVHRDAGPGRDRAGDFDVERHFSIGLRFTRQIGTAIDTDRGYRRHRNCEFLEECLQIGSAVSGTGGLAAAISVVELR